MCISISRTIPSSTATVSTVPSNGSLATTKYTTPSANTTKYTTSLPITTTSVCILSPWGSWSPCSPECQFTRYQYRSRSALNGTTCNDLLDQSRPCDQSPCQQCTITRETYIQNLQHAPPSDNFVGYLINSTTGAKTNISVYIDDVIDRNTTVFVDNCTQLTSDCKYSPWCEWSKCNVSCGQTGYRTREQSLIITDPSHYNPLCPREITETSPCTSDPCPCIKGVNCTCNLTTWNTWSQCSLPCGGGQRERLRKYQTNSTEKCTPQNLCEIQPCNVDCCPVDGKFTTWSTWSVCSKSCGSGVRRRSRSCTAPHPSCKGSPCEGCTVDTRVCNTQPCGSSCSNYQIYSDCANGCDTSCDSLTCDNQCQKPDKCIPGCICPGNKVIGPDGQCITPQDCPCRMPTDNTTLINGESNVRDPCITYTCKAGCIIKKDKNCTVCDWSSWTPFSDCTDACNGTQSRFRTYDGPNCPNKTTTEDKRPCSSNCTVVCYQTTSNGTVVTYKVGDVISQTPCNRTICRATGDIETQPLNGTDVDGQWNLWSLWTDCSQTCNGIRTRYRLCTSPAPQCNGNICMKLSDTEVDTVTVGNDSAALEEIERDRCNQLCYSSTTPASTSLTTPHDDCYLSNGTQTIVLTPNQVIPNPTNSCEICRCKDGSVSCSPICSEDEQTCLYKQAHDPDNRYTWIPPQSGQCCGVCNMTTVESKCRVQVLQDEYVIAGQCRSLSPVEREQCVGGCESQASNILTIANVSYGFGNSTCQCCAPKETYTQTISMNCNAIGNSGYIATATYTRIRSCACKVCKG